MKRSCIKGHRMISQELFLNAPNWYALYLSIVKGWTPEKAIEYMLGIKMDDDNRNIKDNEKWE